MLAPSKVIKDASEKIIGMDANKVPVVDCPAFKKGSSVQWADCPECGAKQCLTDITGTYYHRLSCSKSNGIGYGGEIASGHRKGCPCSACIERRK